MAPATHWLALVVEPVSNQPLVLDLANLAKTLPNEYVQTERPFDQFSSPRNALTTAKSVIFYDVPESSEGQRQESWKRFVRIEQGGAMEYCESLGAACNYKRRSQENAGTPIRVFLYVQIIGLVWSFLFAAKRVYSQANYAAGVKYFVNLVGAKDTMLVQFSRRRGVDGQSWREPFDIDAMMGGSLENWRCRDAHFQAEFQIALGSLGEGESKKLISKCAEQLGLAYNHQSLPRCFDYGTDVFPWESFHNARHG